ncbi:MAG: FUSC family protein [Terriglobales bacterium]
MASSARTAIAAAASFLIARLSGLPEPYWAAITTLVIMQSTLGPALKISGDRFVGTFLGAVSGGVLAHFLPQSWWAFGAGLFVLGVLCSLFHLQYAYRFAGITLAIVMLIPHNTPTWIIALHRFIEVSIGIVVGLAITAMWPEPAPRTS